MNLNELRVLVVDDDAEAAARLAGLIGAELGAARVAPDAYQALERLREENFDVVVTEVALPGASGIDLLERLGFAIPAVVLTWLVSPAISARALAAGADAVLTKPAPIGEIMAAVRGAAVRHSDAALAGR